MINTNEKLKILLTIALQNEVESRKIYLGLADRIKNFMLKDKIKFLAEEEEKHRIFILDLFNKMFPKETSELPNEIKVPLPQVKFEDDKTPISEVLEDSMKAEMEANKFYLDMAENFKDNVKLYEMILYLASMEIGHYKLLEIERDNAIKFEDLEMQWPMVHEGV